jgi:two-component system, NarL family, nitrate/nitrite response regulator NarL
MPITIVLADDHPLVLEALQGLFASEQDMQVVASCRDGESALELVRTFTPDILLLDLSMPVLDGVAVLERLQTENWATNVVVFTGAMNERRALDCLRLGVCGVVLKEAPSEQLLEAVRKVAAGELWLEKQSYTQAMGLMLRQENANRHLSSLLTSREIEILVAAARGSRNKEIAQEMTITEGTVKMHLHHIFEKLGLQGRTELIRYAHKNGLV